jgi:hypothetical protein
MKSLGTTTAGPVIAGFSAIPTGVAVAVCVLPVTRCSSLDLYCALCTAPVHFSLFGCTSYLAYARANTTVINIGPTPLCLFTVYAPAEHNPKSVHKTKEEGDAAEEAGKDEPPAWATKKVHN